MYFLPMGTPMMGGEMQWMRIIKATRILPVCETSMWNSYGDQNTVSDCLENIKIQFPTVIEFSNFF